MELYKKDPYLKDIQTTVVEIITVKKKPAIHLRDSLVYPGGGGQPADKAWVWLSPTDKVEVARVLVMNKKVYLVLNENRCIESGHNLRIEIDWNRRYCYMRYHSAAHVLMASVKQLLENYIPKGIEINDEGKSCTILFDGTWRDSAIDIKNIICNANELVNKDVKIHIEEYQDIQDVAVKYAEIFRGSIVFYGPVTITIVEGWDANPCGGTHVKFTSEIGQIVLTDWTKDMITFTLST